MAKRRRLNRNPDHGKGLLKRLAERPLNIPGSPEGQPGQYVLMDFDITWDVMPDHEMDALPEATRTRLEQLLELVYQTPKSVISELRDLMALHPNLPCLMNWLINCLRSGTAAERREALKLSQELFHRMPNYLFARTTLSELWLEEGEVEKAAELVFTPGYVFTRLYPDRKVFHISEIRHWFYLCARIKICLGEPEAAKGYRDILAQLEPDSPAVRHLDAMLNAKESMAIRVLSEFKKLLSKGLPSD